MENRTLKDQAFWFGFSYLLPFLPAIFLILGPDGASIFTENYTSVFVTILSILMAVLMSGLGASTLAWMRREKARREMRVHVDETAQRLPHNAIIHLRWTTALNIAVALLWWYLVFS